MFLEVVGIFLIVLGLLWLFSFLYLARYNHNYPKSKREKLNNYCILIPARNESKVIEDLLISIQNQTLKTEPKNVYIIVESKEDPTIEIAKKYGATIFIRKHLELKSKGYALNELIMDLEEKKIYYEAYFIFDADNVLDKNFMKEMEKSYQEGYDIAIGYRNLKNGDDSIISACSGLTFAFLNSNGNDTKSRQSRNVTLSGTGLYIVGDLIQKWKAFPFHSLTEDYELTLYSIANNLTSVYNEKAEYFDEQPVKYKNTINQRARWIRGFFTTRKKYVPEFRKKLNVHNPNFGSLITGIMGMNPYIMMIIGAICYILNQVLDIIAIHDFKNSAMLASIYKILIVFFLIYFLFCLLTAFILFKDKNKMKLSKQMKVKAILFNPLYFVTYVQCALLAIKKVEWKTVEHNRRWEDK